jgi:hypothetical protein
MTDDLDEMMITVRADTGAFRNEVNALSQLLATDLGAAADSAGRRIEASLLRAVRTGKFGFEELRRTASAVLADIASAAIHSGVNTLFAGSGSSGLLGLGAQLAGALLGAPGRAVGGPVAPGRAYQVGERGPEVFVPSLHGRVEPVARAAASDVRLSITINAPQAREPEALAQSGRQIARAVRHALERAG